MDENFEQDVRRIIREELSSFIGSSQYVFQKDARFFDGRNIQIGFGTGTQIGTDVAQKLAFYGKTPISQPSTPASTFAGIIGLLQSLGLSQ